MRKIMAKQKPAGRAPLSTKKNAESADLLGLDLDYNIQNIDPELRKELDDQGLVPRWINAKQYLSGGNFHKSGWRAYGAPKTNVETTGSMDFAFGRSPEGY